MLKNRHFISYFSTTLIYLAIAGIVLFTEQKVRVLEKTLEEKAIPISLSSFVPEVLPVTEELKIEEEPIAKEEPDTKEEPAVEPEIIKEPILAEKEPESEEEPVPEPIVKKIMPKPIVQKAKKKPIRKKTIKKKTIKKRKVQKKKSGKQVSSRKSKSSKAKKNQFLANIRAKINRHKSYPRIAKKRGMQGSVKVTFTILRSGKVGHITLNGPKIFHNSARKAVKSAFPIGTKNIPISLPLKINITLRYQIR
ncbi:MAG: TonB family protein [Campylobacterota bacterium]|nr:TonB family protein [Campylobacterota bacterium]